MLTILTILPVGDRDDRDVSDDQDVSRAATFALVAGKSDISS